MFSIIAAIGKNRELGKSNQLLFHIKDDMKFFRETTSGHQVIMGRKTWDSLPGKLKNRKNIVVSRNNFNGPDQIIHELNTFIKENSDTTEEFFIIGGGAIYREFLPHAKTLYLTEVDATVPDADTFFPKFDNSKYHQTIIKKGSDHGLTYSIIKYSKHNPKGTI